MTAIKLRRGTAEEWNTLDPVLLEGEPGYETDTGRHKFGDGVTKWTGLPYYMPVSILETMFAPIGTEPISVEGMVAALQEAGKLGGATLLQTSDAAAARDAIGAIAPPAGTKIQLVKTYTTLTGLTRPSDPNGLYAIEFRGAQNPVAAMVNDDTWAIVE